MCGVISQATYCFWRLTRFFVSLLTLHCSNAHALLFLVCWTKQKNLLMKCAPGHTLSLLKPNSFALKWKPVVSVLSPLASKSHGGSHNYVGHKKTTRSNSDDWLFTVYLQLWNVHNEPMLLSIYCRMPYSPLKFAPSRTSASTTEDVVTCKHYLFICLFFIYSFLCNYFCDVTLQSW